ncbi:MAG: sulfatase family protein [Planctomycetota bacterium]|jgi:arylsulfatase A-like enzyme
MIDLSNKRVTRRNFLRAVAAAAMIPAAAHSKAHTDKRPNIIFFLTDDQDKNSIGAYGGKSFTPNLDRMAREGMVFHRAFVSSTVCTPSRYSFLTGRYAGRSYSGRYVQECPPGQQGFPSFNMELEDDNMNVGAILQRSGYATGYVGKFHVGPDVKRPEEYEEMGLRYVPKDAPANAETTAAFRHNERWYRRFLRKKGFSWAKHIYWGNLQGPFNHHNPEWTVEAALEFIDQNKDRPFYLHYCTTLTHGPDKSWSNSMEHPRVSGEGMLDEIPNVMTKREDLLERLEDKGLDPEQGHAGYAQVDDSIGAILKKLDELGIADNTLIVFTSDHGSNMKGSLFNLDGVCVPWIMRWPKAIKAGAECDELVQNIDLAPTFFDIAGAKVPGKYVLDGRSLRPLFGAEKPERWRDHLYFEMGAARAVCTKDFKYVAVRYTKEQIANIRKARPESLPKLMAYIGRAGIGTRGAQNPGFFDYDQLYDLRKDPKEQRNLAADAGYSETLSQMRRMLKKDLESFGRPFGEFAPGGDAAPPGQIDEQVDLVKRIRIEGKKIILPDGTVPDEQSPPDRRQKATDRENRRAGRKRQRQSK